MTYKPIAYELVLNGNRSDFVAQVNKLLSEGWYLHGDTFRAARSAEYESYFSQAFVKYEDPFINSTLPSNPNKNQHENQE